MGTLEPVDLAGRLEAYGPASLLAIGPRAGALIAAYRSAHPDCRMATLDADGTLDGATLLDELAGYGRVDFVILRGVLERVRPDTGANLLARLRDVHAKRFCLVLNASDDSHPWQASALIAMGLTHWCNETVDAASLEIHGFDLGTYKATPDWLNARHWAHPQHWGKERW
jgi:hypothetical protein